MWKDSETEIDYLDYDYLVKSIEDIILDDALLPASIGVYGDWGSGKSSLMHMCKKRLEIKDKKITCLLFNGWLFENYEDAKTAIIGTILDEIGKKKRLPTKAKEIIFGLYKSVDKLKLAKNVTKTGVDFLLNSGLGSIADIMFNQFKSRIDGAETIDIETIYDSVKDGLDSKEFREDIRSFQSNFGKLLDETKISRLVIFIDELDRCRPDTILDTLEAMKLFMFKGKIAFVIGADERHISYAVKSKFKDIEGIQINIGKEYLEKLIQYPVKIPRLNSDEVETYISCLLLQLDLEEDVFYNFVNEIEKIRVEDFEQFSLHKVLEKMNIEANESIAVASQVAGVLSQGLNGNPRQCKRFLNSMYMRLKMAEFKNKVLDKKILAKIMLLEYIRPQLFKKIANMAMNGILQSELTYLENRRDRGELIQGELTIWEKDEWFRDWCEMEPKLSDKDLRLYFYFMRTSLDEKLSRISSSLSPVAKGVLDKLMSKSDIKMLEALEISDELASSEKANILNAMATNMLSQTKIEKEHIESFTKFVIRNKELSAEALAYFSNFSAKQLSVGGCVYIAELAKKTNMESEYRALAMKWGNIEKNLQQGIENALGME
ncbi:P-loop NTPase fold protein [Anaerovibrio slackiae]|uniref:KAP family P-loop NTPase fold protein n=1 Tax=Anaerovibrio slackiae TaxID=2652309 RepID=UPI0038669A7D